jgi:uncharacterized protein YndB with AHSA1/START domain
MLAPQTPAGTDAIERSLDLRASPERVWRALTDAGEISSWFGARCELDVRPGGEGFFEWPEHGMRFAARVEAVDPPRRLAWRWSREHDTPIDAGPSTLVDWRLEPLADGGTRLRMRETGFDGMDARTGNVIGWQSELGDLVAFVAAHRWEAGIRRTWALRSSPERVWAAFTDPVQLATWWTRNEDLTIAVDQDGWMSWPNEGGRFAIRFEAIEPRTYLCWSWVTDPDVPVDEATQVLRTEWVLAAREDGGTDLTLLETGFVTEHEFEQNDGGWPGIIDGLRGVLGESAAHADA